MKNSPRKKKLKALQKSKNAAEDLIKKMRLLFAENEPAFYSVSSQIRMATVKLHGARWTEEDKCVALSLYYTSPSCYRQLRSILKLPSVSVLKTIMSKIDIKPGFSDMTFDVLKSYAASTKNPA